MCNLLGERFRLERYEVIVITNFKVSKFLLLID